MLVVAISTVQSPPVLLIIFSTLALYKFYCMYVCVYMVEIFLLIPSTWHCSSTLNLVWRHVVYRGLGLVLLLSVVWFGGRYEGVGGWFVAW